MMKIVKITITKIVKITIMKITKIAKTKVLQVAKVNLPIVKVLIVVVILKYHPDVKRERYFLLQNPILTRDHLVSL